MSGPVSLRPATIDDIDSMHIVRLSVRENQLSDPSRVTREDYRRMIQDAGRGWVCEDAGTIVGFGVVDRSQRNVWALFVAPHAEGVGVGSALLGAMIDYAIEAGIDSLWLTTTPGTRAEPFYRQRGWEETGISAEGEVRFELQLPSKR